MKRLLFLILVALAPALFTLAGDKPKQPFNVTCPECDQAHELVATSIFNTGSWATNNGYITQRSAQFHCPACHADFTAQVKPDVFVPADKYTATPPRWPRIQALNPGEKAKQPATKLAK